MQKIKNIISPLVLISIFLSMVFTRSFVGLEILGFRLGEFVVLTGYLLLIFICLKFYQEDFNNNYLIFILIFTYFVLQLIFTKADLLNSYTFKAGSFIAMTSFYFLGLNFPQNNKYVIKIQKFLPILIPITYIFGSSRYPKFIGDFFLNYSDKYEFIKASDILMVVVVIVFYFNNFLNKKLNFIFIFIVIPLFLPQLLYLSRGSFIALALFFIMELFSNRKILIDNILKTIIYVIFGVFIFVLSTLNIYGNLNFEKTNPLMNAELEISQTQVLQNNLQDLIERRNYVGVLFSLYFDEGVLKSTDGTLNWRLDIWQDLLDDMSDENKNLFGYGYNEILPVMTDPQEPGRMGVDGMNENIHNYFLNIFARGGILLLGLFLYLHCYFVIMWKKKHNNFKILNFIIPLLIASFFDVSMEGVQFPLNYYFFIGTFLSINN